jgi:alpha-L-rhamnosidase
MFKIFNFNNNMNVGKLLHNHRVKGLEMVLFLTFLLCFSCKFSNSSKSTLVKDEMKSNYINPPASAQPGVYWYFMDGNLSKEGMTKDLEAMKEAGISNLIFLEVGIGVPRGTVDFMSEKWQEAFVFGVHEAERLGIKVLLGAGPGWCGSGGPWVKPEEAMRHLVFSETDIVGDKKIDIVLPIPKQRSTPWHKMTDPYYKDYAVYAIPSSVKPVIEDVNEKALYERYPYSSHPNVKTHLPALANYAEVGEHKLLNLSNTLNVSQYLKADGRFVWYAPKGDWTIIRMGIKVTGASTRPSPEPVIGLESDKLNAKAFENHLKNYTDILLKRIGIRTKEAGLTGFHIDSWESGSQNWTDGILEEFQKRRGYDAAPFLLTYTGRAVKSVEISERFLWDLRQTCKELLLENHAGFAKNYAHKNGLELSIEPYDMNPAGDLDLGAYADMIMAEFWSKRFGYTTYYAVNEATSISHITGRPVVGSEVFTSSGDEVWQEYPWSMKDQSDWALASGINRFIFHTFAHKPFDDYRPGMTMGIYGVHWDRTQTWWSMVGAYHKYISRYSYMLQQGQAVSDILYLTPEGAPMVFTPPADALEDNGRIPDKKGHGFDGCSPKMLMDKAGVENGKIAFPKASSYYIMVLPNFNTMTPELLKKIMSLVEQGATIIGSPPLKSPSLVDYPNCDVQVKALSEKLWGTLQAPNEITQIKYGKGSIFWGGDLSKMDAKKVFPDYGNTAKILSKLKINQDFSSKNKTIRYGHRQTMNRDIYFIANKTADFQETACTFRSVGIPELWIGTTGEIRKITNYTVNDGLTTINLKFSPSESFVVTFSNDANAKPVEQTGKDNFPQYKDFAKIEGSWKVLFDPKWGGPAEIEFDKLQDWTKHQERGIKYYSGIATYKKTINVSKINLEKSDYYINLGEVHDIASVKLNGQKMGVIWCAPWQIKISDALKEGDNVLEIEVANRWINRLVGDRQAPDANVRKVKFENGLLGGKEYTTGRYTFTTELAMRAFKFKEPLTSGLLGPVTILEVSKE